MPSDHRFRYPLLPCVALGAAVTAATAGMAAAQTVTEARDFSVERFALASDRLGVLGVEGAAVPARGTWDVHLWLGTANDPLVVYMDDATPTRLGALVGQRTGGELGVSYAVHPRLNLALDVPLVLAQDRAPAIDGVAGMLGGLGGVGLGDVRLRPKLALLSQRSAPFALAVIAEVELPTAQAADYRGDDGIAVTPTLALSRRDGAFRWAVNLGYAARPATQLAGLTVDDELRASLGAAVRVTRALELGATVASATAAADPFGAYGRTSVEVVAGPTVELPGAWTVFAAGGAGVDNGYGTPDWRALAGIRLGRRDRSADDPDGDGVRADRCPDQAEDVDGFEDDDGCPDPDNDGDGIPDDVDGAPMSPEDFDGVADDDGIPDPDNDGDGIPDDVDRCPAEAENVNGFDDEDGCHDADDSDGDGLQDDRDACRDRPEDRDGFEDSDGCPDADNDGDGLPDDVDRCPMEGGRADTGGCPDTDRDGDGVVDRLDNCPDLIGVAAYAGCAEKQLVTFTGTTIELLDLVYFQTSKAIIEQRSNRLLDNVAAVVKAHPEITRVVVEGHTDDRGDDARNKDLSQRRADAVVAYLVQAGLARALFEPIGYGEERPLKSNRTPAGRAANRRVEFKVSSDPGGVAPVGDGAPADGHAR